MFSIGEILKRARLDQGLDLSTVSARTKISSNYLVAIESDDRKKLPSGFFYKSFVDQYARALSLDTTQFNAELERVLTEYAPLPLPGQDDNPIHRVPPMSVGRFRRKWPFASFASLILVMFGCSAIYAWWHNGRLPVELPSFLNLQRAPDVVEAAKKPEAAPPADVPAAAHQESEAVVPAETTPASITPPAEPRGEPSSVQRVESPDEPVAAVAETAPVPHSKLSLDLIAVEKTWLSVSSDGKPVFSGVLAPKQTKKVTGKQFARLKVGNAAGLKVRLNGKAFGPLGARGQVLVVLFTPDNFQVVSPTKEGD